MISNLNLPYSEGLVTGMRCEIDFLHVLHKGIGEKINNLAEMVDNLEAEIREAKGFIKKGWRWKKYWICGKERGEG